jgi:membrane associated rhomboid family serine protease
MIPLKDNIPTDRFPIVTVALILANVVVYLLSIRHGGSLISGPDSLEVVKYGATPYALTHSGVRCGLVGATQLACGHGVNGLPAWQTVFTAMFMHASILHIAGNMLFLWIFGNNVEDSMGPIRFLIFYLLGGVAALALQVAVGPNTVAPTLGASGAIAAVLGGYLLLYPTAAVVTFIPPFFFFPLPAVFFLVGWFALQILAASSVQVGSAGGGVAYFAHIGGFAFGLLTIRWWVRKNEPRPPAYA